MTINRILVICTKTFGGGAERTTVKWVEHLPLKTWRFIQRRMFPR